MTANTTGLIQLYRRVNKPDVWSFFSVLCVYLCVKEINFIFLYCDI
jgi:hypothetical protein